MSLDFSTRMQPDCTGLLYKAQAGMLEREKAQEWYAVYAATLHFILVSATENVREVFAMMERDKGLFRQQVKRTARQLQRVTQEYDSRVFVTLDREWLEKLDDIDNVFRKRIHKNEVYIMSVIQRYFMENGVMHRTELARLHTIRIVTCLAVNFAAQKQHELAAIGYPVTFGYQYDYAQRIYAAAKRLLEAITLADYCSSDKAPKSDIDEADGLGEAIRAYVNRLLCDKTLYDL